MIDEDAQMNDWNELSKQKCAGEAYSYLQQGLTPPSGAGAEVLHRQDEGKSSHMGGFPTEAPAAR